MSERPGNASAGEDRRRKRLLRELARRELASVGIFGGAVCQVCGVLDTFSGWAGAMKAHRTGAFIGVHHGHDDDEARALLASRSERFCEVCREPEDDTRLSKADPYALVHARCARQWSPALSRKRYAELRLSDTKQLARFLDGLDATNMDLRHRQADGWRISASHARAGLAIRSLRRRCP